MEAPGEVEGVTLSGKGLGPVLVEDDAGVQLGGGGKGQARGHVGLDEAGDHLCDRPLGGQDQMDPGGAGQLGDALDGGLDVLGGRHHEVGKLVDDDQEIGVGAQLALGARQEAGPPPARTALLKSSMCLKPKEARSS